MVKDRNILALFSFFLLLFSLYLSIIFSSLLYVLFDNYNINDIIIAKINIFGLFLLIISLLLYFECKDLVQKRIYSKNLGLEEKSFSTSVLIYLFPEFHVSILFIFPSMFIFDIVKEGFFDHITNILFFDILFVFIVFLGVSIGINITKLVLFILSED